ncbi:tRNA pseudouridine(38-40) synthase TruA [Woodsholea maritima]|uniref:tRNA pseudouridine(38-40) synthase TruA n=1 Tax=Woodsholea maritima TaxID=240237 RepID=UPI00036E6760|nr:tRNA pseudouridine(38-40) synthase TruA [Woodsholea maritima]
MARFKLTIEYEGTNYVGWQRQDNGPSIQEAIETACEALDGGPREVYGAGRTDSGVHALGQVAHVDLERDIRADKVRDALNYHLKPQPIAIVEAQAVSDDFHARFSAIKRGYVYRLIHRRAPLTLTQGQVWRVFKPLDVDAMHAAAQYLIGEHDFTTFRDAQCQADSPVKSMDKAWVAQVGDEVHFRCAAISFLHRQVRSIVGSLAEVGTGKWSPKDFKAALDAGDRKACGPVAPPDGLYLDFVDYD